MFLKMYTSVLFSYNHERLFWTFLGKTRVISAIGGLQL